MNKQRALSIAQAAIDLMARKNADYGSANIIATGAYGIGVRLLDKTHRILNLTQNGKSANFESVEDTFLDIMNYGLIGKMLSEGTWDDVSSDDTTPTPLELFKADACKASMVYLAGAIDDASADVTKGWRQEAAFHLAQHSISAFNPFTAFHLAPAIGSGKDHPAAPLVRAINRAAIVNSGAMLVNLLPSARPFGTIREIEFAVAAKKPVFVVGGDASLHLDAHDTLTFDTMEEAIAGIIEIL